MDQMLYGNGDTDLIMKAEVNVTVGKSGKLGKDHVTHVSQTSTRQVWTKYYEPRLHSNGETDQITKPGCKFQSVDIKKSRAMCSSRMVINVEIDVITKT